MERDHPFDEAPIRAELAKYLTPRDLSNCSAVSQTWFDWFIPYLWHTRTFHCNLSYIPGLNRYRHHVRVIKDFAVNLAVESRDHWSFPNLQSVQFVQNCASQHIPRIASPFYATGFGGGLFGGGFGLLPTSNNNISVQGGVNAARVDLRLVKLLDSVPLLRDLTITLSLDNTDVYRQFLLSLQTLSHLNRLELVCNEYVNPLHIQQVLNACRQCEILNLKFQGNDTFKGAEEAEEYVLAKIAMEQMQDMAVKTLYLETSLGDQESTIMVPLLKRCPLVEEVHLYDLRLDSTLALLQGALRAGACPRLKTLFPSNTFSTKEDPLPALLSVMGPGRDSNAVGLQTLTISAHQFLADSALAITQHLSQSMTVLNFQDHIMKFEVFNELVTGLPHLESLRARVEEISAQTVDINKFDQMCTRDWVCLGLKKLQLGSQLTQGIPTVKTDSWKQSLPRRCMDYMFSQFARLENLEEWDWVAGPVDLFILTGGYLRTLSNLKQLRRLGLGPSTVYRMGAKEAEWVAENWTSLQHVNLSCQSVHIQIADSSRVKADKLALDTFIHTLRSKRPSITFHK
ncbi:hypothetical protein BGX28_006450 [Mortierella sp. GBA30]|nr:hypothetical protein BGX28_006450 [Mortierella sp. GBA30]